jgi:hypothetical protein
LLILPSAPSSLSRINTLLTHLLQEASFTGG